MKVVALTPVKHGKRYEIGEVFAMADKEAAQLIAAGFVEEAAAKKADAKAEAEAKAKAKAEADAKAAADADAEAKAKAGGSDSSQQASS